MASIANLNGYTKFDNSKSYLAELISINPELISREENKFFAVNALFSLAALQIICGTFILFAQIALNNVECYPSCLISHVAIWCGCFMALNGFVTALTTHYKTDSLLVVSGLLNILLYGISIFSFMSVFLTASPSVVESHKIVYAAMAIVAAVNVVVSILTSAFFCRAGCSCCQPHAPAIMYLTQTETTQIEINDGNLANEP